MCLGTHKKKKQQHSSTHAYIQRSCHPNLNPVYHPTIGVFFFPQSRRWLACSLYASSEINEFNLALFPLCLPFKSSLSYSPLLLFFTSPRCIKCVLFLFVYLFICCFSSRRGGIKKKKKQRSLRYLGLIAGWGLAAVRVIEERDRNVLIRSPQMLRGGGS